MVLNSYAAWPCWMVTWIPLGLTLRIIFAQKGGYESRMISRYDSGWKFPVSWHAAQAAVGQGILISFGKDALTQNRISLKVVSEIREISSEAMPADNSGQRYGPWMI